MGNRVRIYTMTTEGHDPIFICHTILRASPKPRSKEDESGHLSPSGAMRYTRRMSFGDERRSLQSPG